MLFFSACKSQEKQVSQYFKVLEERAVKGCMESDLTAYKKKKNPSSIDDLKKECEIYGMVYKRMNEVTQTFIDSLKMKDNKEDFIIIHERTSDLYIPAPIISILKLINHSELSVVRIDEENKISKKVYRSTDLNDRFIQAKRKDILDIENYLIKKNKTENVQEKPDNINKPSIYHVIAKVNGNYIMKLLYCFSK